MSLSKKDIENIVTGIAEKEEKEVKKEQEKSNNTTQPPRKKTLQECIINNSLDTVKSGEVCSIDIAKKLGIFDNTNYYIKGYEQIKTFNTELDNKENRSLELCIQNNVTNTAKASCTMSAGINYISTIKDGKSFCVPVECPTGFKLDSKDPSVCVKPKNKKLVSLRTQNQERWYDWFIIPNYHIGNKYNSVNNVNYAPCKRDTVPMYDKHPVDNEVKAVVEKENNNIGKCLSKEYYFGGKYSNTENYSPISLIKRISTREELEEEIEKKRKELLKSGYPTDEMNKMLESNYIQQEARDIIKLIDTGVRKNNSTSIKRILQPTVNESIASKSIHTKERLEEAYNKCVKLNADETVIQEGLVNSGTPDNIADIKIKTAKAACQRLFNKEYDGLHTSIGKDSLDFKGIENVELKADMLEEKEKTKTELNIGPSITSNQEKNKFKEGLTTTFKRSMKILLTVIGLIFIAFIIYPILKYVWLRLIKPLFSRRIRSEELANAQELNARNMVNIKK